MRKIILTLLCSGILSLTLLSSIAIAAEPAPLAVCPDGNHSWGGLTLIDHYEVVVERNHECTICGAKVNLYQRVYVYEQTCKNCGQRGKVSTGPTGPTYSNHSCYN